MIHADCPGQTRHGDYIAYCQHGCRCPEAREDWRIYNKRRREGRPTGKGRLVDATGTRRRIEALMCLGYSQRAIAAQLGRTATLASLRRSRLVYVPTAQRVAVVYDRLSMTPGPSVSTRNRAERSGLVPPLGWDEDTIDDPNANPFRPDEAERLGRFDIDWVNVWRATDGVKTSLTYAERNAAVERVHREGLDDLLISERLHLRHETVLRIRKRLGLPANVQMNEAS